MAVRSKATLHFIQQFEKTGRTTTMLWRPQDLNGLAAIRAALEAEGIAFTVGVLAKIGKGIIWWRFPPEDAVLANLSARGEITADLFDS